MTEKEFNYQKDSSAFWKQFFISEEYKKENLMTYEDHVQAIINLSNETAESLILAVDDLLDNTKQEVIFLQAAGNGLKRYNQNNKLKNEPIEPRSIDTRVLANAGGYFTNINETTYKQTNAQYELNHSLTDILDHIIVVGGVELISLGKYQLPDWAGYGDVVDIVASAASIHIDGEEINGTSFSTPMTTGAAALIWAQNPDLKASEVKARLLEYTLEQVPGAADDPRMYPLLNAAAFIDKDAIESSIYNDLIETFQTAIKNDWGHEKQFEAGIGLEYHHDYQDAGYEIIDINNDGKPEMLVGTDNALLAVFTLKNEKPELILGEGIRNTIHLYEDGIIEYDGIYSIAAGESGSTYYSLNVNGELEAEAGYTYSESEQVYKDIHGSDAPTTDAARTELELYIDKLKDKYNTEIKPTYTPFIE